MLLCPWDFPGKSTGVGCHFLLWRIFPTKGLNPGLPHCKQDALPSEPPGKSKCQESFYQRTQSNISKKWSPMRLEQLYCCRNSGNLSLALQSAFVKWMVCQNLPGSCHEMQICSCNWLYLSKQIQILRLSKFHDSASHWKTLTFYRTK